MRRFAAILILCLAAACGTTPPATTIEGVVTLDGQRAEFINLVNRVRGLTGGAQ